MKKPKMPIMMSGETMLMGQAALAEFLSDNGFPMTRTYVSRLINEKRGPEQNGFWSGRALFSPEKALQWANDRMKRGRARKTTAPRPLVRETLPSDVPPARVIPPSASQPKAGDDDLMMWWPL